MNLHLHQERLNLYLDHRGMDSYMHLKCAQFKNAWEHVTVSKDMGMDMAQAYRFSCSCMYVYSYTWAHMLMHWLLRCTRTSMRE